MRPRLLLAAALLAAHFGCGYGSAPRCTGDDDCEQGRRCIVAAGVCVGYDTPLLPAPDGGADAGPGDGAPPDAGDATDAGAG